MSDRPLELEDASRRTLERALAGGADEVEVAAAEADSLDVCVRLGDVETLKRARERRLAVRVFLSRSSAVCSSADLGADALDRLVDECCALARRTAPDPFAGLPEAPPGFTDPPLEIYDPGAEQVTAEEAIAVAKTAEHAALSADPRITRSEGAEFDAGTRRIVYATSRGAGGEYRSSSFSISVNPVAADGKEMQQDYWYSVARRRVDLDDAEEVGRTAARRTVRRLGARPVPTGRFPVVFDPEAAASFIGHFAAAVSGSSIYRGTSFLRDRLGQAIGNAAITLIDDPLLPRRLGSRPFDAEGLPTRRNVVVERGVLCSYLLDSYSARKLGLASTASAVRALGDVPYAGASNFFLAAGDTDPGAIIASVDRGLYVTELVGFGVNPITGDFSRGVTGLWIEDGCLVFPVQEVTIAGNLLEMLRDVETVGNDLRLRSNVSSPTLRIASMTVAGVG